MQFFTKDQKKGSFRKTLRHVSHYLLNESVSCQSWKIQDSHLWCAPCKYIFKGRVQERLTFFIFQGIFFLFKYIQLA